MHTLSASSLIPAMTSGAPARLAPDWSDHCCEPASRYVPTEFRIKQATQAWERREAHALRRAVFCVEQGVFVGSDVDAIDAQAQLLVACSCVAGDCDQVVGTVRIHEAEPGVWWGSRLAVHPSFREHGLLGSTLIKLAVGMAHAQGAHQFWAHVQGQNVPLFERLNWCLESEVLLHGRPHGLMQASLAHYPPCHTPEWGHVTVPGASRRAQPQAKAHA
jgi:putative N-acetyltransferase (TIGR04045 family)